MPKHHKLLIVFTFLMGFLTGVFGYFWSRTTDDGSSAPSVMEEVREDGYELLVTVYGGCERIGCPSFRLQDDGTYQYLAPTRVREYARYEDAISAKQNDTILGLVEGTSFEDVENTEFLGTCPITYDGIAYRFDIRVEAERYSFDSCVEDLENEPLFVELVKYFGIMEAIHGSS